MIEDRIFWIYFIVTIFFIIVGTFSLIQTSSPWIIVLWFLSNLALMIIVYHTTAWCAPMDTAGDYVCVIDEDSCCFDPNNRIWLLINILFIILLVTSVVWAGAKENNVIGIIMLFLGLIFLILITKRIDEKYEHSKVFTKCHIPFWMYVFYITIWTILTLNTIITL